jgi:hypothetical protein
MPSGWLPSGFKLPPGVAIPTSTSDLVALMSAYPSFRPSYRNCDEVSIFCPIEATTYGYFPNLGGNIFFAVWFGLCLALILGLGVWRKTWTYTLALSIGALLELLGYIGRIMLNRNPWGDSGFELQICCLILGPSFIAAAIYLTMKHLVLYFGPQYSYLQARLYPWLFIGADLLSIVIQAIGGGVSASASNKRDAKGLQAGNRLLIAGIAVQVATMSMCGVLVLLYLLRWRKAHRRGAPATQGQALGLGGGSATPDGTGIARTESRVRGAHNAVRSTQLQKRVWVYCGAVVASYVFVLIRCIYRYVAVPPLLPSTPSFLTPLVRQANNIYTDSPKWQAAGATRSCARRPTSSSWTA